VLEVYELDGLEFADAYLVACAEASGVGAIAALGPAAPRPFAASDRPDPVRSRES
jgi:hypothetical protein